MNIRYFVFLNILLALPMHAMEPGADNGAGVVAQPVTNKELLDNAILYKLTNPEHRNVASLLSNEILDPSIKQYILAKTMLPKALPYSETRSIIISPDQKKAAIVGIRNNNIFLYNIATNSFVSIDLGHGVVNDLVWSPDSTRLLLWFRNWGGQKEHAILYDYIAQKQIPLEFEIPDKIASSSKVSDLVRWTWHPVTGHIIAYYYYQNNCIVIYNNDGTLIAMYDLATYDINDVVDPQNVFCWAHPTKKIICFGDNANQIVFNLDTALVQYKNQSNDHVITAYTSIQANTEGTKLAVVRYPILYDDFNVLYENSTIDIINLITNTKESIVISHNKGALNLLGWEHNQLIFLVYIASKFQDGKLCKSQMQTVVYNLDTKKSVYSEIMHDASPNFMRLLVNTLAGSYKFCNIAKDQRIKDLCAIAYGLHGFDTWKKFVSCLSLQWKNNRFARSLSSGKLVENVDPAVAAMVADYRACSSVSGSKINGYLDQVLPYKIGDHNISLDQTMLLNAIAQQHTFDSEGPKGTPFELDAASHTVFKTLPHAIQHAIKPLVIERSDAYYKAKNTYHAAKKSFKKNKWLLKHYGLTGFAKIKANDAWQAAKQAAENYLITG